MGFFPPSDVMGVEPVADLAPRCGRCGLYKSCRSPKMRSTGKGRRKILVVAEAPGEEEDRQGVQLVGETGQHLRRILRRLKVDLDRDCWKTNAVVCLPSRDEEGKRRKPSDQQVEACRPNLMKAIDDLRPDVILLLGAVAVKSLIGCVWREEVGPIGRWVGWRIPSQQLNAWICPTWHPSYLKREGNPVLDLWFRRHLEGALELEGQPHPGVPPDCEGDVELVYEAEKVGMYLNELLDYPGDPVSFDYETNMLKPDSGEARIHSCAVAWRGFSKMRDMQVVRAIAYPWHGEAIGATGKLLRSDVPKIAANIKFEDRWTWKEFGHGVRNWRWDTMVAAHVLDNRPGITSLKFQSFVRLGQGSYDNTVGPYLKADGSNEENRMREVELGELLKYNAMDALLTYQIAMQQMKEMGL